ncbi:MAG: 23S rRNA (uracil(1939)-C(5))-methyltransferase RlmD, partial [Leptospira sp.]|nr:23S rRNA (uracil(1939)-C(5))-methyltransferase RlmD [Leptospira sp.]
MNQTPPKKLTICKHFGTCGGCSFLDLDYSKELKRKENGLRDSFQQFRHLEFRPIIPSPEPLYYRHKIQVPFGRRMIGNKLLLNLGLFNRDASFVLDQTECQIQDPGLTEILLAVKQWARRENLLPYNEKSKRGLLKYLVARKSYSTGEILIGIVTEKEDLPHAKDSTKRLHTEIQNRLGKSGKLGKLVG